MRFLKEHPWRSGAVAALLVLASALAVVVSVRDGGDQPAPRARQRSREHASHGLPPRPGAAAPADHGVAGEAEERGPDAAPSAPAGFAPVELDPSQAAAMGLTTAVVGERDFSRTVRTVGVVAVDETRTAHVHARVRGWIEGFHVQYVGQRVKQGARLVSLYSQEVYAAQLELAALLRSTVRSPELLAAARSRLALWEVPRSVIEHVERTGEPQRTFPILAPRAGVVVAKQAFEGLFVDPSVELYTISDLSRVWVVADIYEADVPDVRVGTTATLTIEGLAEPVTSSVTFLNPTIDERTRTRKARFEVANPRSVVMPGAFVTVELALALDRGLAVPESAVIRTGTRAIVFVVHGRRAEPRVVTLGARAGEYFEVEAGLTAGERVATGAQFLLDSESRLRATGGAGGAHAGH